MLLTYNSAYVPPVVPSDCKCNQILQEVLNTEQTYISALNHGCELLNNIKMLMKEKSPKIRHFPSEKLAVFELLPHMAIAHTQFYTDLSQHLQLVENPPAYEKAIDETQVLLPELSRIVADYLLLDYDIRELFHELLDNTSVAYREFMDIYNSTIRYLERVTAPGTKLTWDRYLLSIAAPQSWQINNDQKENHTKFYLSIGVILVGPVSRLPRYQLLLNDLNRRKVNCSDKKHWLSKEDNKDHETRLRALLILVNERIREAERKDIEEAKEQSKKKSCEIT